MEILGPQKNYPAYQNQLKIHLLMMYKMILGKMLNLFGYPSAHLHLRLKYLVSLTQRCAVFIKWDPQQRQWIDLMIEQWDTGKTCRLTHLDWLLAG